MRPFQRNILLTVLLLLALFCMTSPVYAAQSTLHVNADGKTTSFQALTTGNLVFCPPVIWLICLMLI